jgi:hypothetical protein
LYFRGELSILRCTVVVTIVVTTVVGRFRMTLDRPSLGSAGKSLRARDRYFLPFLCIPGHLNLRELETLFYTFSSLVVLHSCRECFINCPGCTVHQFIRLPTPQGIQISSLPPPPLQSAHSPSPPSPSTTPIIHTSHQFSGRLPVIWRWRRASHSPQCRKWIPPLSRLQAT